MDEAYLQLFSSAEILFPFSASRGDENLTDQRRGGRDLRHFTDGYGTDETARSALWNFCHSDDRKQRRRYFPDFLSQLSRFDCKAVIYVEYVPVTEESRELAFGDEEREWFSIEAVGGERREAGDGLHLFSRR